MSYFGRPPSPAKRWRHLWPAAYKDKISFLFISLILCWEYLITISSSSTAHGQDKNSQMLIKAVSWLCFKNNSISRFKSSPFTFHPQAKDVESPMVSRLQHLCGSSSCIGGKTRGPFFVFVLFVSFHYSCWFYNYILCFDRFEFNSRCTTKVGTNKLVKPEYFQDQREAPEKAAAQRWIHKTHK